MNDKTDNVSVLPSPRRLEEAIREVKNAVADRDDVVIEMREAERMRLELLANELAPVIGEVPAESELFDFAISSGLQPRFWIDAVSHVSMGRDKRTFRFLKDTRIGRVVLAESTDMKTVANQVTRYLAERIVERERLMEGGVTGYGRVAPQPASHLLERQTPVERQRPVETAVVAPAGSDGSNEATIEPDPAASASSKVARFLNGLLLLIAGIGAGLAAAAALYWDRLELAATFQRLGL